MKKIITIFIFLFFLFIFSSDVHALTQSSDLISNSAPGENSNHTIFFRVREVIPPEGKIRLTPESGFFVNPGFGFADVDLAVAHASAGPYTERTLMASSTVIADGVFALASTSDGMVEITLNSTAGINAGQFIRVKLGTNAAEGGMGTIQIRNPQNPNAYGLTINIFDNIGNELEKTQVKVFIIEPVAMSAESGKRMLFGSPAGLLAYGTVQSMLSLETNYQARCRYAIASNTPYASMSDEFSYLTPTSFTQGHSITIAGLQNGHVYNYFVRCIDEDSLADDMEECFYRSASTTPHFTASGTPIISLPCQEYWIKFAVTSNPGEGGDSGDGGTGGGGGGGGTGGGSGGGTGGGGGSGGGGGGSGGGAGGGMGNQLGRQILDYLPYPPRPGAPGVVLTGWAFVNTDVTVLKDGTALGLAKTDGVAAFGAFLKDLTRGVYTFGLWSTDSAGRRSNTYSTTFWIDDGTQTIVSDIVIPPTIATSQATIPAGNTWQVIGESVPDAKIIVWLYPNKTGILLDTDIIKTEGTVGKNGKWSLNVPTSGLAKGKYRAKAKTTIKSGSESEFGQILDINIGEAQPEKGICSGADLNKDGKVNLTDFSILLYYWGTNNACADQNHDGIVNIVDFSIMMYYWTG